MRNLLQLYDLLKIVLQYYRQTFQIDQLLGLPKSMAAIQPWRLEVSRSFVIHGHIHGKVVPDAVNAGGVEE